MHLPEWRSSFDAFLAHPEPWDFLESWARESACLPIYSDWTHAFGVTEDGTLLALGHEVWRGFSDLPDGAVSDLRMTNTALREGAKRHAWLAPLFPSRPADAQDCSMCARGELPPGIVCYCGGAGWVPASDTWVNKDRFEPPRPG